MRTEEVEICGDTSNSVIIRHPGRSFPGVLIQGDSLNSYVSILNEAIKEIESGDKGEGLELMREVQEALQGNLTVYVETLKSQGMELPFKWPHQY